MTSYDRLSDIVLPPAKAGVASIMTLFSSASVASSSAIIRSDTPCSPQRSYPLQVLLCGAQSYGASRLRKPQRFTNMILANIRQSSARGLPWYLVKIGSSHSVSSAPHKTDCEYCSNNKLLTRFHQPFKQMLIRYHTLLGSIITSLYAKGLP